MEKVISSVCRKFKVFAKFLGRLIFDAVDLQVFFENKTYQEIVVPVKEKNKLFY
jgi:hypothetical protein